MRYVLVPTTLLTLRSRVLCGRHFEKRLVGSADEHETLLVESIFLFESPATLDVLKKDCYFVNALCFGSRVLRAPFWKAPCWISWFAREHLVESSFLFESPPPPHTRCPKKRLLFCDALCFGSRVLRAPFWIAPCWISWWARDAAVPEAVYRLGGRGQEAGGPSFRPLHRSSLRHVQLQVCRWTFLEQPTVDGIIRTHQGYQ